MSDAPYSILNQIYTQIDILNKIYDKPTSLALPNSADDVKAINYAFTLLNLLTNEFTLLHSLSPSLFDNNANDQDYVANIHQVAYNKVKNLPFTMDPSTPRLKEILDGSFNPSDVRFTLSNLQSYLSQYSATTDPYMDAAVNVENAITATLASPTSLVTNVDLQDAVQGTGIYKSALLTVANLAPGSKPTSYLLTTDDIPTIQSGLATSAEVQYVLTSSNLAPGSKPTSYLLTTDDILTIQSGLATSAEVQYVLTSSNLAPGSKPTSYLLTTDDIPAIQNGLATSAGVDLIPGDVLNLLFPNIGLSVVTNAGKTTAITSNVALQSDIIGSATSIADTLKLIDPSQAPLATQASVDLLQSTIQSFIVQQTKYDKCEALKDSLDMFVHSVISTGTVAVSAAALHANFPVCAVVSVAVIGALSLEAMWNFAIEPSLCH